MDVGFVMLLLMVGVSGLLLLALRETAAMGLLLALHLATVMALFLTLPYGKFVHGIYRFAALVRFHVERRRPVPDIAPESQAIDRMPSSGFADDSMTCGSADRSCSRMAASLR